MSGPYSSEWMAAYEKEYRTLEDLDSWDVVPLPDGARSIGVNVVFKRKYDDKGELQKFKARIVARGDMQVEGRDFNDTYAPTLHLDSFRAIVALAALNGWEIYQDDVDAAFLNAPIDEEVYVRMPPGYQQYGPNGEVLFLRLKRSLYGLRQSPANWSSTLHDFLVSQGLVRSKGDPCVYVLKTADGIVVVGVFVDDLIFCGSDIAGVRAVRSALAERFSTKGLGKLTHYLGIEVDQSDGSIVLSQCQYVDKILAAFNMTDCNPVSEPLPPSLKLTNSMCPSTGAERERMKEYPVRQAIGALMYLSIGTRPDISHSVRDVARFCSNPGFQHWQAVQRIFRYVRGTRDLSLRYSPSNLGFFGFCDSNFAQCPDTSRSVSGSVFLLANCAVSWTSSSQKRVAVSTTEAEYYAAFWGAKQCMFLRQLLQDLCFSLDGATPLLGDNRGCVLMANNPGARKRTKHIRYKYHMVRELVEEGDISVNRVPKEVQLADIFTKNVDARSLQTMRSDMMGVSAVVKTEALQYAFPDRFQ